MKKFLYNNQKLRERRRELRRRQTNPEEKLWQKIRDRQLKNYKFYRQYSIGPYILDFYCPKVRLAVELDGKSHSSIDAQIYDKERTQYLSGAQVRVLRFNNSEILENLNNVIAKIKILLET